MIGAMTRGWFRRFDSFAAEAESDAEFWLEMTPEQRVALVDQMRREWQELHGGGEERLRRTARVFRTTRR